MTFHLENKTRNELMKKQEGGTKTRTKKTKGMGSLLSQVLLPTKVQNG